MVFALNMIWLKVEIKPEYGKFSLGFKSTSMNRFLDEKRYISFGWSIPSSCRPLKGYPAGFQWDRKKAVNSFLDFFKASWLVSFCLFIIRYQDDHNRANFAIFAIARWLGIRLDMICVIFATFVIYVAIITQSKAVKLKQQMAKSKCAVFNFGTHGLNPWTSKLNIAHFVWQDFCILWPVFSLFTP